MSSIVLGFCIRFVETKEPATTFGENNLKHKTISLMYTVYVKMYTYVYVYCIYLMYNILYGGYKNI